MTRVDWDKISYVYVNIQCPENIEIEKIGVNLSLLYLYINEHTNAGSNMKYGNAYRIIKKRANDILGRKDKKISKRQVASLRRGYPLVGKINYVKIPYSMHIIFEAIFDIVEELSVTYPLPTNLKVLVPPPLNMFMTALVIRWI